MDSTSRLKQKPHHHFSDVFKKPWKLVLILLLVTSGIATVFYVYHATVRQRYILESNNIPDEVAISEITQGIIVKQTFKIDRDVDGIALLLATYNRKNNCDYDVEISDITNKARIYSGKIQASSIRDNRYYNFVWGKDVPINGDAQYEITISSNNATGGNAITIWSSKTDTYTGGELFINGVKQQGDLVFSSTSEDSTFNPTGLFVNRLLFVLMFFTFIILHILLDISKMYEWIFRKRVLVAAAVIVYMVANQYNFSSITMYDDLIQPNQGSAYIEPVFGRARPIRSDEWLVGSPGKLSAQYSNYTEFNSILRAEKTPNLSASGLYLNYSALSRPLDWGYYLLGASYGFSFSWAAFLVLTFLFSFEMCLIMSNRKRLISLMGAALITFSGYFLWWSYVNWILSGQAALVCIYYFIHADKKFKKILCGVGIAIFGACFASNLYPAWQVPAGFLYLSILIWILVTERKKIKAFDKFDWGILGLSLAFLASIVISYFTESQEYIKSIMNTIYPGKRVLYGGFSINKLFYYLQVLFYPFREIGNPSEAGVFLSFYPIPTLLTVFLLFKKKGRDLLSVLLLSVSFVLSIYCIVEIPPFMAKILLLTFSSPERMIDVIGFIQIYLLVVALSRFEGIKKIKSFPAWIVGIVSMELAVYFCHTAFPNYLSLQELLIIANVFVVICVLLLTNMNKKIENALMIGIICVSIASGAFVNPIVKGLDVIYSKPAAKEIMSIVKSDSDAKWISLDNIVDSGFLVSCGAPTINSVNYIPNYELWKKLDPQGIYNAVYNRYAHMLVQLVPESTSASLSTPDSMVLALSYQDMEKIGVRYIFSRRVLNDNTYVSFEKLYDDSGYYVYMANYR